MSSLAPVYTIYGLLSTTSGLVVRHTGPAGQTAGLLGSLKALALPLKDGSSIRRGFVGAC